MHINKGEQYACCYGLHALGQRFRRRSRLQEFPLQSVQQGNNFTVTITNDGIGPTICPLSEASPTYNIPDHPGARVKPLGALTLLWDNDSDVFLVSFSGTLNSMHPTKCDKVVVASFD